MKYFMTFITDPETGRPPSPELYEEMGKFLQPFIDNGKFILGGALMPMSQTGAAVKVKDGKWSLLDGPFAEAKEVVAGFSIVEVGSREEALEISRQFTAIAGDGEGEMRLISED